VSGGVATLNGPVKAAPERLQDYITPSLTQLLIRLATFLALAAFALGHWLSVIHDPPVGRAVLLLLICAGGGVALWLTGERELSRNLAVAARILIVVAMALLALLATGLPFRNLHH
jgi:drug/metabolite transporter (DMT)-like permease